MTAPVVRPATAADRDALLALDALAAEGGNRFTFDGAEQTTAVRGWLLDRGVAESTESTAELLEADGRVVGLVSVLSAADLQKRRLLGAAALRRGGPELVPPAVAERMRLAGGTMVRCAADDAYLARIAVAPGCEGRGFGALLLARAIERARALGARRLLLDVADDNARALAFYARHGFVEVGRAEARADDGGRRLAHVHLALALA